jgi:SAM-dependent methyltransferase
VVGVPRPVDHAEDDPGRVPGEGRLVARYDDELWELVPDEPGPPPDHLVTFVRGLPHAEHALDLGCGDGRLTAALRAGTVTAADVSEVALRRAAERLPGVEIAHVEPDAPLPFVDGEFDLVLCAETIEHVRDVQLFLSEIRRVLRPGGGLAITTPAHSRWNALKLLVSGFESGFDPLSPHLRFFTRRSVSELLDAMGFDVASVKRKNGTLLVRATR